MRQFNFLSILIGGAPDRHSPEEVVAPYAARFGTVNTLAGDEFNRGIRAYYFGFAALGWFVHPGLFVGLTVVVLLVLREARFSLEDAAGDQGVERGPFTSRHAGLDAGQSGWRATV